MKKKIIARRMNDSDTELIEVRLSNSTIESKAKMIENMNDDCEYWVKDKKLRLYVDKKYNEWIRDDGNKVSEDKVESHNM